MSGDVVVRPMAIFGIFDLLIGGGLIAGLIVSLVARVRRGTGSVAVPAVFGAALALLVLLNVVYFNGFGTDPVISSPTRAQVTGTWVGDHGATLVLRPDGTFTASGLPPYVGYATDFGQTSGIAQNPWSGHGTWVIGPEDSSSTPDSVIFTLACDAGPNRCMAQDMTFNLQAEASSPSGGPALFYYLGDPDDWSDQYAFLREP
jgi:hypothetical protein